jgi:hypothetical protein
MSKTHKPKDFYKTTNPYNTTKKEIIQKNHPALSRKISLDERLISRNFYQNVPDENNEVEPLGYIDEDGVTSAVQSKLFLVL